MPDASRRQRSYSEDPAVRIASGPSLGTAPASGCSAHRRLHPLPASLSALAPLEAAVGPRLVQR